MLWSINAMIPHVRNTSLALLASLLALGSCSPAYAQFRGPGFERSWDRDRSRNFGSRGEARQDERFAGKVEVERFVSRSGEAQLGHGPLQIAAHIAGIVSRDMGSTYEAAVANQLILHGYDSLAHVEGRGQNVSVQVIREVAEPAEDKKSPVSGEAEIGVSNRGSYYAMGVNLDFTEPRKALLSTRMNARITDAASGEVLWEGRATLYSRDGDEDYGEGDIAERLASALFAEFPAGRGDRYVD